MSNERRRGEEGYSVHVLFAHEDIGVRRGDLGRDAPSEGIRGHQRGYLPPRLVCGIISITSHDN